MNRSGALVVGIAVFLFSIVQVNVSHAGLLGRLTGGEKKEIEKAEPKGEGNLRYTISVADIEKNYVWAGPYNAADAFSAMLTDALQESGHFVVLGSSEMRNEAMKEQDLVVSGRTAGGKKAPKMGRMTPAQLLVRGVVTHVQSETSGGGARLNFKGISIGGSGGKGEVNITIYLVDTETGQVKASTKIVGESGKRGLSLGYHGSKLGGLTGTVDGYKRDNVGQAIEHAVSQAVEYLVKQLENVKWEGTIMLASGDKVIVNRGEREGVQPGQRFVVGEATQLVDPDTGEVLATEMDKVGEIEVTSVKEKICYCKPISGGEAMKKGLTVQPAGM